jgi:hypothetical protein
MYAFLSTIGTSILKSILIYATEGIATALTSFQSTINLIFPSTNLSPIKRVETTIADVSIKPTAPNYLLDTFCFAIKSMELRTINSRS